MTDCDAEYRLLTTGEGLALLDLVGQVPEPGPAQLEAWRRQAPAAMVHAALRIQLARRKAAGKLDHAERLWLDPVSAEQATASAVAAHKAQRFQDQDAVVDLCAGTGGDTLAFARQAGGVLAVELDAGRARRLLWNADVAGVRDRLLVVRARAEAFAIPHNLPLHLDPDRRARNPHARARLLEGYTPGPAFFHKMWRHPAGGALKLSPASPFDDLLVELPAVEVEVVSLRHECKEATLWFGPFAGRRRRATCLPAGATWTDRDAGPGEAFPQLANPGHYLFEPDPALVRGGLLPGFAAAHELAPIAPEVDFLTGPSPLDSPWLISFAVESVLPLDRKRLRKLLRSGDLGQPEIKSRRLDWPPDALPRPRAVPPGTPRTTLILIGGKGPTFAIVARRLRDPATGSPGLVLAVSLSAMPDWMHTVRSTPRRPTYGPV